MNPSKKGKSRSIRVRGPRREQKALWSKKDRRGPADKAAIVGSELPIKKLRTDYLGLLKSSQNLGGVPAGPINVGQARLAISRKERGGAGGGGAGGGGPCPASVARQSSSGLLITTPKVVLLWWSTYFWDQHLTERHYYRDALTAFGNDSAFWNRLSEYGITSGSFGGTIDLTRFGGPSASISEQSIQDALTYRFNVSNITPDPNAIYVVMLPNGITSAFDTANNFIGHHRLYTYKGNNVWYAVVEYSANTSRTLNVITHEVYEAASDPDLSTGYLDSSTNNEIGDLCNLQTTTMDGYPVQQVWSQKACSCI
jgi:hypothetical protein